MKEMKEKYETPKMDLVRLESADIITTSGADNDFNYSGFVENYGE